MAFMMMQTQLCTLIHHFDFQPLDQTIQLKPGNAVLSDVNGVRFKIQKRIR